MYMDSAKRAQKIRIKGDDGDDDDDLFVQKSYCGISLNAMIHIVLFLFMLFWLSVHLERSGQWIFLLIEIPTMLYSGMESK